MQAQAHKKEGLCLKTSSSDTEALSAAMFIINYMFFLAPLKPAKGEIKDGQRNKRNINSKR